MVLKGPRLRDLRSSQNDYVNIAIPCPNGCGRSYKLMSSLTRHLNLVKNINCFNSSRFSFS